MASLDLARWYVDVRLKQTVTRSRADANVGGLQGYQMAKNLQGKLPPSDTIRLFDINNDAVAKLSEDMSNAQAGGAAVVAADSVTDAARDAVSNPLPTQTLPRKRK